MTRGKTAVGGDAGGDASGAAGAPVTIRDAIEADAAEVAALADLSWDDVAEIEGIPRTRKRHPLTEKKIRAHGFGKRPHFSLVVAERDGRLLGFLLHTFGYWTQEAEPFLSLDWLFVRKEARRQAGANAG